MKHAVLAVVGAVALVSASATGTRTPAARAECQGGAPASTSTRVEAIVVDQLPFGNGFFFGYIPVVAEYATITTTVNYKNVVGLTYIERRAPSGTTITLSAPQYLLNAYGGSLAAIQADLAAGYLHDRGPCT